jgi:hypothetical protein
MALPDKLRRFIRDFKYVAELAERERDLLHAGADVFRRALSGPDLLPPAFALCDATAPRFYQIYADPFALFAPASLALAPLQEGPVLSGLGWRMAGVLSGTVLRRAEGGAEAKLRQGEMEISRAGAAQYVNLSAENPALLLFAFKIGDTACASFNNAPEAPPFGPASIERHG